MCRFSVQNQTVFWTGEFVSGNIECIKSDHQELKLKSIDVELIGLLAYKRGVSARNGLVRRSPSRKIFFNRRLNLRSANAQGNFLLPYGNDNWPFRFFLNDSLPPSFKPNKPADSYIYYLLQIVFVRPEWYKKNIKKSIPIVVKHTSSPVDATNVEAQGKNRKDLHIHVILQKSTVAVGKNVSFDIRIQNPKEVLINQLTVTLAQHLILGPAEKRRINLLNETLKTLNQFQDSRLHENFQFHVPHTTPPTFSFHIPSNGRGSAYIISYELYFEAHLRGLYTNILLKLPLIITDHPQNN